MTRLRQTIARRLKEAQNTAAMLTTFNDVDMSEVMELRKRHKDAFEKKHGVKLGFMGFFVRAVVAALKEIPSVNAEIDGTDIIYKNFYNVSVAVGTDKGLVVPVVRDADTMTLAEIEAEIGRLGALARDGKLSMEDLQGGTFTISNGGVYGSLMSTPILNPPQSGVLGMHRIEERPVVVDGKIIARPMMYLALSYDHRIVDGKEAVTFLVRVKKLWRIPSACCSTSNNPTRRCCCCDARRGHLGLGSRMAGPARGTVLGVRRFHAVPADPDGDGARQDDVAARTRDARCRA